MKMVVKIIRSSIHSFFRDYHTFASLAIVLIFPASAATLLSASSSSSSALLAAVSRRLRSLFEASNLPLDSRLFDTLLLKLSQTILSFLFALPFSLTFLTLSKASIISAARDLPRPRRHPSILPLYPPLLLTHLLTTLIILAANIAVFSMFAVSLFAAAELRLASTIPLLLLSGLAAITYSTVVANVLVVCNLASVVSAMESCGGYAAVLKACVLIRGKAAIGLSLALCSNVGLAAIEALFQIRVMKIYNQNGVFDLSLVFESLIIIYIYSVFRVVDVIISCGFYKCCRFGGVREERRELKV